MDDIMVRVARMRGEELLRDAERSRRADEARRAACARQAEPAPARGSVIRPRRWLAVAAAWVRPTATGR